LLPPADEIKEPCKKRKKKAASEDKPVNNPEQGIVEPNNARDDEDDDVDGAADPHREEVRGDNEEEKDPEADLTWGAWTEVEVQNNKIGVGTRTSQGPTITGEIPTFKPKVTPGPRNIPEGCKSAFQIWSLLFDSLMVNTFVEQTNIHGQSSKGASWKHMSVSMFLGFVAIIYYMGIVRMPEMKMHWETKRTRGSTFVKEIMGRNKFKLFLSHLHYINVTEMNDAQKAEARKQDGFWLLSPWLKRLSDNFLFYFSPFQLLDIDEKCIRHKGRHRCRCYNPNKPSKWLLKAYALNDSVTGYLLRFFMYQGSSEVRPADIPATEWPVMVLLNDIQFWEIGLILSLDNWYTSLAILFWLGVKKIHMNGTIKVNRKGLPKEFIYKKTGKAKKEQGSMSLVYAVKEGIIAYFTSWMDSKPVHLLCSYLTYKGECERVIKEKKKKKHTQRPYETKHDNKLSHLSQ